MRPDLFCVPPALVPWALCIGGSNLDWALTIHGDIEGAVSILHFLHSAIESEPRTEARRAHALAAATHWVRVGTLLFRSTNAALDAHGWLLTRDSRSGQSHGSRSVTDLSVRAVARVE